MHAYVRVLSTGQVHGPRFGKGCLHMECTPVCLDANTETNPCYCAIDYNHQHKQRGSTSNSPIGHDATAMVCGKNGVLFLVVIFSWCSKMLLSLCSVFEQLPKANARLAHYVVLFLNAIHIGVCALLGH